MDMVSAFSRAAKGTAALIASVGLVGGSVLMAGPAFAATAQDIGTQTSKNVAIDSYKTLVANDVVEGNYMETCDVLPVAPTAADKDHMLQAVNAVRTLAHVDPLVLGNAGSSAWLDSVEGARTLAMVWKAGQLSKFNHAFGANAPCYTEAGSKASNGSLAFNTATPPRPIQGLVTDEGESIVGHRINAIDPALSTLYFGGAKVKGGSYDYKALILGTAYNDSRVGRTFGQMFKFSGYSKPSIVAWPSAGYFPAELLQPQQSGETVFWSVSLPVSSVLGASVQVKVGDGQFQAAQNVTASDPMHSNTTPYPTVNGDYSTVSFVLPTAATVPTGDNTVEYTVRVTVGDKEWTYPVKLISGETATKTTSTETGTNTGTTTQPSTGTNTGTTTQPSTGTNTGSTTQPSTGTNTGTTTQPSTGTNTGSTTQPSTGTNTGTTTQPSTGTNTGSTTQPSTGTNTGTTTQPSTGTNTGSTTQPSTGTNTGTTTQPSTGTNTGSTTQPSTGTNTGTTTQPSTGTNTGSTTQPSTGTNTGTTTQPSTGTNTQQPGASTQQPGKSSDNGGGSGFGFVLLLLIPLLLALFFGPLRGILPF